MGGAHVRRGYQPLKHGPFLAEPTFQGQSGGVGKSDRVWDLRFERSDFRILLTVGTGSVDLVLACIKTQAFSEADGVGSWNGGAETLNGREDLLEDVELDIWFQSRVGLHHILWAVRSFCGGQRCSFRVSIGHNI